MKHPGGVYNLVNEVIDVVKHFVIIVYSSFLFKAGIGTFPREGGLPEHQRACLSALLYKLLSKNIDVFKHRCKYRNKNM
jgi:hypothetical protein